MLSPKLIKLPDPASASYAHQMLTLCLDKGVTNVYVLDKGEAEQLIEARQLFGEYYIQLDTNAI